jgi:hypothetical protein
METDEEKINEKEEDKDKEGAESTKDKEGKG